MLGQNLKLTPKSCKDLSCSNVNFMKLSMYSIPINMFIIRMASRLSIQRNKNMHVQYI